MKDFFFPRSTSSSLSQRPQKAVNRQDWKRAVACPREQCRGGGLFCARTSTQQTSPLQSQIQNPYSWHANVMTEDPVFCLHNPADNPRLLTLPLLPIIPRHRRQGKWGTLTSDSNRFFSVHFLYLDRECQANEMNYKVQKWIAACQTVCEKHSSQRRSVFHRHRASQLLPDSDFNGLSKADTRDKCSFEPSQSGQDHVLLMRQLRGSLQGWKH